MCRHARAALSHVPPVVLALLVSHGLATTAAGAGEFRLSKTIPAGSGDKAHFSQVAGMFVDAGGTIHLTDGKSGKLVNLGPSAVSSTLLAGKDAPFRSTQIGGLAPMGDSAIVVASPGDSTLAVIDKAGKLQYTIGESGSADGQLSSPRAVVYSTSGRLYVADTGNNRISVYTRGGVFIFSFGNRDATGKTNLSAPTHIAVDAGENIYVLDSEANGRVSVYSHAGELLTRIGAESLGRGSRKPPRLTAMAVSRDGEVFVADRDNGKIIQIDWRAKKVTNAFGSKGKGRGQFRLVSALAVTPAHQIVVADARNKKIEIYELAQSATRRTMEGVRLPSVRLGKKIAATCEKAYPIPGDLILCLSREQRSVVRLTRAGTAAGALEGSFKQPALVAMDDKDVIIVDGKQLKIYSHAGKLRFAFGRGGSKDGRFKQITGVYLRDKIYVADSGRRVQIFSRDGVFLDKLANHKGEPEIIRTPGPIVVDSEGNIYVADSAFGKIRVFSPEKKLLYELGKGERSRHRYKLFTAMALDQDDNLYVLASTASNRQTVHIYEREKMVFSFGSFSKGPTGFSGPTALTVPASKKTTVSVYDKERQTLRQFEYLQVPGKVAGLVVSGGVGKTALRWQASTDSFVDRYAAYGSAGENGPYTRLSDVVDNTATIRHAEGERYVYYRVAAVSGFGVEGPVSQRAPDLFQTSYGLYQKKKYAEAAKLFAGMYQKNPQHGEALEYLGLSLIGQKKYDEATRRFAELARIPGFEVTAGNREAESLFGSQQFISARAAVDRAIAAGRGDAATYLWCGKIALKLGDYAGAVDCLEESLKLDPSATSTHFLLGQAYLKFGAVDKGLAQIEQAGKMAPDDPAVWVQAGLAYQGLGRHKDALASFDKALALDRLAGDARLGAAQSHIRLQEYDQARSIALSMAGVPEQESTGRYLLGLLALANDQPQEAVLSLSKAAKKDPGNGAVWLALADAYLTLGDVSMAGTAARQAAKAEPGSFEARFRLATLEQDAQDHKAAARNFAAAVKLDPAHYDARYRYALSLLLLERFREASEQAKAAARLLPEDSAALMLLADIAHQNGKDGDAIDYLKKALAREPASAEIEIKLGRLYLQSNMFDLAQQHLEKATLKETVNAVPHALLGQLFLKRRLYDQAIIAFTNAVELDDSQDNRLQVNVAFAAKKKSLEFDPNAPMIILQDLQLSQVFSAAYKQYANAPVGHITVTNVGESEYKNLKLTFQIKQYMDFPTSNTIPVLKPRQTLELPLLASFNNKILDIDEDTGIQVEVKLKYYRAGEQDSISITQPMTIYGKNAIVWKNPEMVGSFITPKDETLKNFVRQAVNSYRPEKGALNDNIVSAMTWFNVLSAYGMNYVVDPNTPFPELTKEQVDYVQFPRETLRVRSGDCDDLSVLLSAGLENLGIQTALVDIPGHLFLMFNTGLPEKNKGFISLQDELMAVRDGEVWIPLEATMIATSFSEAWAEGARKYQQAKQANTLHVIPTQRAWKSFRPVTLAPAGYSMSPPVGAEVSTLISRERAVLVRKSIDRFVEPYRAALRESPADEDARMQIAIIYAKNGLYEQSFNELDRILQANPGNSAAHNNRGNIYYMQRQYDRALKAYRRAEEFDPDDGGIKINLALAHYRLGNFDEAVAKHGQATPSGGTSKATYKALATLLKH